MPSAHPFSAKSLVCRSPNSRSVDACSSAPNFPDRDFTEHKKIHKSLSGVGGIQFSVGCAIIGLATFVPVGAFAFNPKILSERPLEGQEVEVGGTTTDGKDGAAPTSVSGSIEEKVV